MRRVCRQGGAALHWAGAGCSRSGHRVQPRRRQHPARGRKLARSPPGFLPSERRGEEADAPARRSRPGMGSNQRPHVCKTSALPVELLAPASDPGQGVKPRSPRSERGVLPVRRSRSAVRVPLRPSPGGRSTQQARPRAAMVASYDSLGRGRTMFSKPLAYPSTLDRRPPAAHRASGWRPTWRSFGARASHVDRKNSRLKQTLIASVLSQRTTPRVFLSQAGPRFRSSACSS